MSSTWADVTKVDLEWSAGWNSQTRVLKLIGIAKNNEEGQNESENKEEDYENEQYSLEDEKYKQLEDRLNAVENLKMSGLNFDDLSLVLGVVIPRKFKVPTFAKYDGISCLKLHLKSLYSEDPSSN